MHFACQILVFNAAIELALNKYSCSMLKRIRELVLIASLTSGWPRQNSSARLFFLVVGVTWIPSQTGQVRRLGWNIDVKDTPCKCLFFNPCR